MVLKLLFLASVILYVCVKGKLIIFKRNFFRL